MANNNGPQVLSMDGKELKQRMEVVTIGTRDGGKTWYVTPDKIHSIRKSSGDVKLKSIENFGFTCTRAGESRVYVDPVEAVAEARRRTKNL